MQLALWKTWPDLLGVPLTLAWGWGGAMACAVDISQEVRIQWVGWGKWERDVHYYDAVGGILLAW
jgi:hypothetical protein